MGVCLSLLNLIANLMMIWQVMGTICLLIHSVCVQSIHISQDGSKTSEKPQWVKKVPLNSCLKLCQLLFQTSFTLRLSSEFVIKTALKVTLQVNVSLHYPVKYLHLFWFTVASARFFWHHVFVFCRFCCRLHIAPGHQQFHHCCCNHNCVQPAQGWLGVTVWPCNWVTDLAWWVICMI